MLVIVTYDESGGIWDHVAPPKGDRWGPGSRIPAIIVSPFAKRGFVDHTPYDTTSILRLITRRFDLPTLEGIKRRDEGIAAHGNPPLADLTNALNCRAAPEPGLFCRDGQGLPNAQALVAAISSTRAACRRQRASQGCAAHCAAVGRGSASRAIRKPAAHRPLT